MIFRKNNSKKFLSEPYKYGFKTNLKKESFPTGLNKSILKKISKIRRESYFFEIFRKKAFLIWEKMSFPTWGNIKIENIDFQNITYFSIPKIKKKITTIHSLDPIILKTLKKLGISLTKKIKNIALDVVFDSISVTTTYKENLAKFGIIFCSISEAIVFYTFLIKKYLGKIVSPADNFFSALNSSIFSDGSFCFVPQNTICPLELSTYFRINDNNSGQFERTLIIVEKNSSVNYLEGCTAAKYSQHQLHAAVVELLTFDNASIKYSTIQNWYAGDHSGQGGIYNFVTKRGIALGHKSNIFWTQIEKGSSITWKYPSCFLIGKESVGEFYSVALTNYYQQADTGTKMLHLGQKTKSKIISKGISCDQSKNSYRGLVKIGTNANYAKNFSQCDSFLLSSFSCACTYPYIDNWNFTGIIEHEAKISKITYEQLFYLNQRSISNDKAITLLINGFCKDVINMLPFEFINEANKLLSLKLQRSVG